MSHDDQAPLRVDLPADIDRPDNIIGPFTARQITILAGTAIMLWLAWAATRHSITVHVFLAAAAPVALAGFALAVGRRDGISLDRWARAAIGHWRHPRRLVADSGSIAAPPAWVATTAKVSLPAPLRLPAKGITDGLVDLGPDGSVAMIRCSTVNLHLRTPGEQNALVAGFGNWLNSLDAPVQILVRSQRVDLSPMAQAITGHASALPDPDLEQAARRHARFLHELAATRELLHRQVTVVVRDTRSPAHAQRRATEAAQALGACDIQAHLLDTPDVIALLGECLDTPASIVASTPDTVIQGRTGNPS